MKYQRYIKKVVHPTQEEVSVVTNNNAEVIKQAENHLWKNKQDLFFPEPSTTFEHILVNKINKSTSYVK